MPNLQELLAQRAELDAKIKALADTERANAIAKIKTILQENGLTLADLGSSPKAAEKPKSEGTKKVAAKYRDSAGNTWSGRGLQPKWLKAALATGKTLGDFAI